MTMRACILGLGIFQGLVIGFCLGYATPFRFLLAMDMWPYLVTAGAATICAILMSLILFRITEYTEPPQVIRNDNDRH